jgi:hypothetical protein
MTRMLFVDPESPSSNSAIAILLFFGTRLNF